eukprot:m.258730 g.258730  ORF g.258730 m.258730 type:complete len:66 (+) comp15970_c0_seq11:491-688(+)
MDVTPNPTGPSSCNPAATDLLLLGQLWDGSLGNICPQDNGEGNWMVAILFVHYLALDTLDGELLG